MSNLYSQTSNFSGRQQDNQQNIKQFTQTVSTSQWIYKYLNGTQTTSSQVQVLTPANQNVNVYIPQNLTVIGSINSPSDYFLKESVVELNNNDVKELFDVTPVSFTYKNDANKIKYFGVIAQDIEDVYPNLVNSDDNNYKTVNYIGLIPLLLVKMKEQEKEIKSLKQRIEDLETYQS